MGIARRFIPGRSLLERIALTSFVDMKQFTNEMANRQLTVKVMSFVYKKGIPKRCHGNGGDTWLIAAPIILEYDRYKPLPDLMLASNRIP